MFGKFFDIPIDYTGDDQFPRLRRMWWMRSAASRSTSIWTCITST